MGFLPSPHLFHLGPQPRACAQSVLYCLSRSVSAKSTWQQIELYHCRAETDGLHMELGGERREPRGTDESGAVDKWVPVKIHGKLWNGGL